MSTTSSHYKKYDTSLKITERKLKTLEKRFSKESKDLSKLQKAWASGNERVRIAKTKAKNSKSASIMNRVNLAIKKQKSVSKQYSFKKLKVKSLKESIRDTKVELKIISTEKRLFEKAMEKYQKQWIQFYSDTIDGSQKKLSSVDKVDFGMQLRATRALLNLSVNEFSMLIDIPSNLLKQIEQPNNKMLLEPHLHKSIQAKLKNAGIELIDDGLYVGTGGIGVRVRKKPSSTRTSKPKRKRTKPDSAKIISTKKKRKSVAIKVA